MYYTITIKNPLINFEGDYTMIKKSVKASILDEEQKEELLGYILVIERSGNIAGTQSDNCTSIKYHK